LIKLIPVFLEIERRKWNQHFKVICTGQHKELIADLLDLFKINPDLILPVCNNNQPVSETLSQILKELQHYVSKNKDCINYVIGQGDTTSCLGAAMVAVLNQLPFAHIEAGLRTYDYGSPFPEEYFRQIISLSTDMHFAPTQRACDNLVKENISKNNIRLTGNTIVDLVDHLKKNRKELNNEQLYKFLHESNNVIITCHRRENQDENFDTLITTIVGLARLHPELSFIWISHLSPSVEAKLDDSLLKGISNISIIKPINIFEMFALFEKSKLIITDSGGIQEEAVSFNVPTLVIREKTERPEAVEAGNSIVTGVSSEKIIAAFSELLSRNKHISKNPFGDGKAAIRILDFFQDKI
jgi:UDP-N-acetylglucosamine 2-epimerase